jgi:signal transduction histidine kinase
MIQDSSRLQVVRFVLDTLQRSLRLKLILGLVVPLSLILGGSTLIGQVRQEAVMYEHLSFVAAQTSQVIVNGLQHAMLARDLDSLQHMLDTIGADASLVTVYVLDTHGRVAYAPQQRNVGTRLDNREADCQPCHRLEADRRPASVVVALSDGQRVFRSMRPIENQAECQACHEPGQRLNGMLLIDISTAPVRASLAADLRQNLVWWAATIPATIGVVYVILSRLVIRRLEAFLPILDNFGPGRLALQLDPGAPDEIGRVAANFNDMARRLQAEEIQKRQLAAQRQQLLARLLTIQEDERRRVARDLHDDLGQELAGIGLGLDAVERLDVALPDTARRHLQRLRERVAASSDQLYAMIMALRPSVLDDLGLAAAVRAQAEQSLGSAGISYEMAVEGLSERLPPELETAVFRLTQEALSNVVRHAQANRVRIRLARSAAGINVDIADDGRGFDVAAARQNGHGPRGLGLLGMHERAGHFGGRVEIASAPGAGTCLRVWLPIAEEATHG